MAFFNDGERNRRPGVHIRITDRAEHVSLADVVQPLPPDEPDEPVFEVLLSVSPDGVLSATGQGFTLGSGGHTVVFSAAINAVVAGETIVVTNPPS